MPIYVGNTKINPSGIAKVYVGTQLVYEQASAKVLDSITLSGYTSSLNRGDAFSFGGTVTAHYTDSTTADVTNSTTFSGYNMNLGGTYTVTASYTEDGVTKTATYTLTVNKAWSLLWSGSKTIKMSSSGTASGASSNFAATANGTGYRPQVRLKFSGLSTASSGGDGTGKYYNNDSTTTTKPTSPLSITQVANSDNAKLLGVYNYSLYTFTAKKSIVYLEAKRNSTNNNLSFSLVASKSSDGADGEAKFTLTKIEQYY